MDFFSATKSQKKQTHYGLSESWKSVRLSRHDLIVDLDDKYSEIRRLFELRLDNIHQIIHESLRPLTQETFRNTFPSLTLQERVMQALTANLQDEKERVIDQLNRQLLQTRGTLSEQKTTQLPVI